MATIVLTGGGSAGHCTPHLAILPHLKEKFDKIYYIGSENGIEKDIIKKTNIPYYSTPTAKLKRKICLDNISIPFKVLQGIKRAGKILDELKPDVVFSKGGFVSVPTVIAAHKRKIPVISHESDYTAGLANKFIAKYCKKVFTSFSDTAITLKNGEFIGAPIRSEIFNIDKQSALNRFNLSGKKPVILVIGGSLGAKPINTVFNNCITDLTPKYDIIHVVGKGNLVETANTDGYSQFEYLTDIENAFAVCDICVTRAGSNTLFELLTLKKPCVVIPLPKGESRGDQIYNARYFQKLGVISLLYQDDLSEKSLINYINATYANRFNLLRNFDKNPIHDKSSEIAKRLCDFVKP